MDSVDELESMCELLVELAALQRLRNEWAPTNSEDRAAIERFMLLERIIAKKEDQRNRLLCNSRCEHPEMIALLSSFAQQSN